MALVDTLRSLRDLVGLRKQLLGPGMSTSAMVAFYPDPEVAEAMALPGGYPPEELHVTLAFLGSDAVVMLDREAVEAALAPLAAASFPLEGNVSGVGRFTPEVPPGNGEGEWPLVALIDLPALPEFRQRLVGTLDAAGVPVARNHGFCPHMTLAMVGPDDEYAAGQILAAGVDPMSLRFGSIVLAWGDSRTVFRLGDRSAGITVEAAAKALLGKRTSDETRELLREAVIARVGQGNGRWSYVRDFTDTAVVYEVTEDGGPSQTWLASYTVSDVDGSVALGESVEVEAETEYRAKGPAAVLKAAQGPVVKADSSLRYTFAPMYPASPENPTAADLDAHGDFATGDDLQAAVWDYVRKGDRSIRFQHMGADTKIGEWVEIVSWPFDVEVPLTKASGETVTKTYRAGTVFLGTVWTETGWELVQKGLLTGYSLGGSAHRVDVELAA